MYSTEVQATSSILPLLAILAPAGTALIVGLINRREKLRNLVAFLGSLLTFVIAFSVFLRVLEFGEIYFATGFLAVGDFFLKFNVDRIGAFFTLIASLIWAVSVLHATGYMLHEEKRTRFFFFMMLTEAATLGVFLVRDYLSLYLFFEIMGLSAYFIVVHTETDSARKAAAKYLFMTVIGGLFLLMGILLYFNYAGTLGFIPHEGSAFLGSSVRIVTLVFLIAGFGVKAGVVPFHVWLPDAHPVAPSPGSAVLSAVMIKTGAYGILRVMSSFLYHEEMHTGDLRVLGITIIFIALATMLAGAVLALIQSDIKRTLAYSSVSQMGFILFGVGTAVYLGEEGAIGIAGSMFHVFNHALFKACLFLLAGSVLYRTHRLDMFGFDRLYRRMPLTTVFWCVAAMGIMGIPLFNGFASKTLLYHAILEGEHLAGSINTTQVGWLKTAEALFVAASAGTVLYFLKMTYFTFFSVHHRVRHASEEIKEAPAVLWCSAAILALGVSGIGLIPSFVLKHTVVPAAETISGFSHEQFEHLAGMHFFTPANFKDVILPLLAGGGFFVLGLIFGVFREGASRTLVHIPQWLSFDYWYLTSAKLFNGGCFVLGGISQKLEMMTERLIKEFYMGVTPSVFKERTLPRTFGELAGDIALGTLIIAVSLALLLVFSLR